MTIQSDGKQVELLSRPTSSRAVEPLRYLSDARATVPAQDFEAAVQSFVDQVRRQLREESVGETNLERLWKDLADERSDASMGSLRRMEAMLGYEPGEGPEAELRQLEAEALELGRAAVDELAAAKAPGERAPSVASLHKQAKEFGESCGEPLDVGEESRTLMTNERTPAWWQGTQIAAVVRSRFHLGAGPLTDSRLAELATVSQKILEPSDRGPQFSFFLNGKGRGELVLRKTSWPANRRFELARLLVDRLATREGERLFPATRSYTFRQKVQRSFAAELLCPFDSLVDHLDHDLSDEAIEAAAEHFQVAELAVRTLLVNHGIFRAFIPRRR